MSRAVAWRGACAWWAAAALVYVAAVGTTTGRAAEDAVAVRTQGTARQLTDALVASVGLPVLVVVGLVTVLLVGRRAGRRGAAGVALLLAGANATTWLLSHLLAATDLLHGESQRTLGEGFFPSGHATAAVSMACALAAACPARRLAPAAAVTSAYAALVGVALLAPANHYASDVLGAVLLTAGWQALLAGTWDDGRAPARRSSRPPTTALVAPLVGVVLVCLLFGVRPDDEPELVLATALVTAAVFAVGHASHRRSGGPSPSDRRGRGRTARASGRPTPGR